MTTTNAVTRSRTTTAEIRKFGEALEGAWAGMSNGMIMTSKWGRSLGEAGAYLNIWGRAPGLSIFHKRMPHVQPTTLPNDQIGARGRPRVIVCRAKMGSRCQNIEHPFVRAQARGLILRKRSLDYTKPGTLSHFARSESRRA